MPRIVSFLPAGTEIVYALGAGGDLVGRSHECDDPADAQRLPIVSKPALDLDGLSQSEIDVAVAVKLRSGESLYVVDELLLCELAPDVILTQDLCQVCAGGEDRLGRPSADSVRMTWSDVDAWAPEIVVVAPCGFGLVEAERMSRELPAMPNARIVPVDANAFFARPGPRYVGGIELLEQIFYREAASH